MLFFVINLPHNSTCKVGSRAHLIMPRLSRFMMAFDLGWGGLGMAQCWSYAVSLLLLVFLLAPFESMASHIDLNAFQQPNIDNVEIRELTKNLAKLKQEGQEKQEQAIPVVLPEVPEWLKALEDSSYNALLADQFKAHDASNTGLGTNKLGSSSELYIFASLGLNKKHLKALMIDAKRFGGAVIVRGVKNGSFKETFSYLTSIVEKEHEGVLIDPELFKKYNITHVPAFVLAANETLSNSNNTQNKYDIIRGNVTARFALLKMKASGDLREQAKKRLAYAK